MKLVERRMLEPDPDRHEAVNQAIIHLVNSGGKRIRPTIVLLVCKMLSAGYPLCDDRTVHLAAAVEMLHTATLVHDDIIDGALIRRGNPTLNASWSPGATILTGDYLFARAASMASRTESVRVMQLFSQALMTICNGELHQLFSNGQPFTNRGAYYRRIFSKTGALFVLSSEAAGVLSKADEFTQGSLRTFGHQLGIAFQIVDDLLDFVGDESEVGKPLGSDLAQGLVTLPVIYYLETAPNDGIIHKALEQRHDRKYIEAALAAVRDSSAIQRTRETAQEHIALAKAALLNLPDNQFRKALLELASYTAERES